MLIDTSQCIAQNKKWHYELKTDLGQYEKKHWSEIKMTYSKVSFCEKKQDEKTFYNIELSFKDIFGYRTK